MKPSLTPLTTEPDPRGGRRVFNAQGLQIGTLWPFPDREPIFQTARSHGPGVLYGLAIGYRLSTLRAIVAELERLQVETPPRRKHRRKAHA